MKQWRCTVCGYVHEGSEPPEVCPLCGADKSKFVLVEEKHLHQKGGTTKSNDPAKESISVSQERHPLWAQMSTLLTRLHGHPIAVHVPNGVLPITVLFVLIAWLFHYPAIASAAKFNMFFVCLSMPLVILSGLIDWKNNYKARMTKVFKIKIICATMVTLISLLLSIWWLIQPGVYQHGMGAIIFILFHFLDLIAAAVAGWYGGKLVFPKK